MESIGNCTNTIARKTMQYCERCELILKMILPFLQQLETEKISFSGGHGSKPEQLFFLIYRQPYVGSPFYDFYIG